MKMYSSSFEMKAIESSSFELWTVIWFKEDF